MTTIYRHLADCKHHMPVQLNATVKLLIVKKLSLLFNQFCNIDLSDNSLAFRHDFGWAGPKTTVSYKFKYGSVDVSTKENDLEVTFLFSDKELLKVPFGNNRCIVTVDHDLNFKKAMYSYKVCFSRKILEPQYSNFEHRTLLIQRLVTPTKSYNEILHHNVHGDDRNYKDLFQDGLDERFIIPDYDFENMFKKFIIFACAKPIDFYTAFPEYPSYMDFIHKNDQAVAFLNLFKQQYTDNIFLLKQNMLLLDMQEI